MVNADFNKDVKRKFDRYRTRMRAEAETLQEAEAQRVKDAVQAEKAVKAFLLEQERQIQEAKENAARVAYKIRMEEELKLVSVTKTEKLSQREVTKVDETAFTEQQDFESTSRDNAAHSISTMTDLTGTNRKDIQTGNLSIVPD